MGPDRVQRDLCSPNSYSVAHFMQTIPPGESKRKKNEFGKWRKMNGFKINIVPLCILRFLCLGELCAAVERLTRQFMVFMFPILSPASQ